MTEPTWMILRARLVERYNEFRARLTRRLGSADLAVEALQETWLRLDRAGSSGVIDRPDAYLFRVALNVAADRRASEDRLLALSEVEALRRLDEDRLDPARIAEARSDVAELARALKDLPPRCRAIFIAARLNELPHKDIAARFGISVRMVERELKRALAHCGERLGRTSSPAGGSPPSKPSN